MPEHRIKLMKIVNALGDFVLGNAKFPGEGVLRGMIVREEFVKRRIKQADSRRQSIERTKMPIKSSRWYGSNLARAFFRSSGLRARIISRIASMRSPSKNMCSVRQRPMPSAPKPMAFSTCSGVSAFVRISSLRHLSAHCISAAKSR